MWKIYRLSADTQQNLAYIRFLLDPQSSYNSMSHQIRRRQTTDIDVPRSHPRISKDVNTKSEQANTPLGASWYQCDQFSSHTVHVWCLCMCSWLTMRTFSYSALRKLKPTSTQTLHLYLLQQPWGGLIQAYDLFDWFQSLRIIRLQEVRC
jgi:hypothetical protein